MADALELLSAVPEGTADLIFLDPPFNLGKKYGSLAARADRVNPETYSHYLTQVLDAAVACLAPGGALYLYHIPKWALVFGAHLNEHLSFRHWIAISMKNGFVRGNSLYPAHYALLYYTKGEPGVFRRPKTMPATCPACGEFVKDYGGYLKHVEHGINLSDIWDDISPVRHRRYKLRDANELPEIIPARVLRMSGRRNGLFVDPFAGSGSSVVAARNAGMRFIAGDLDESHCRIVAERLDGLIGGGR